MRLKNLQKTAANHRVPHSEISGQTPLEMSDYLLKEWRKDKWRDTLKSIDTITCTAYTRRTRCRRLRENRRPGYSEEDQFHPVKDTSEPAVIEIVEEDLASGHQLTSRADGQYVIRNLLDSSWSETILLSGTTSGKTSAGARRTSGFRPRHNTAGYCCWTVTSKNVNRYFEGQCFKSVFFLGATVAFDALGRVHTKLTKQKQNWNSASWDKSATILQHLWNTSTTWLCFLQLYRVSSPVRFCFAASCTSSRPFSAQCGFCTVCWGRGFNNLNVKYGIGV